MNAHRNFLYVDPDQDRAFETIDSINPKLGGLSVSPINNILYRTDNYRSGLDMLAAHNLDPLAKMVNLPHLDGLIIQIDRRIYEPTMSWLEFLDILTYIGYSNLGIQKIIGFGSEIAGNIYGHRFMEYGINYYIPLDKSGKMNVPLTDFLKKNVRIR